MPPLDLGGPAAATPPGGWRDVAWCGLWLKVPRDFGPYQVKGDARRGQLGLACDGEPRLTIQWAEVKRRKINTGRLVRRQIFRGLGRRAARRLEPHLRSVENEDIAPMWCVCDPDAEHTRCLGFAASSRRLVHLVYGHGTTLQDQSVRRGAFAGLADQDPDRPQRWAMFDLSFIGPAGATYESSVLNMGDMHVRLALQRGHLVVREIYPADLALRRQPLEKWMEQLIAAHKSHYAPPGDFDALQTRRGAGLSCRAKVKRRRLLLSWRTPREQVHWLIHDQRSNRLVWIEMAKRKTDVAPAMRRLIEQSNWAEGGDAAAAPP